MAENIPTLETQNAPSKDLWQHLVNDKMYDKGYDEFEKEYSTSDKVDELHDKLSSGELYTDTKEDFYSDYFPNLKKNKSLSTDSQAGGSEIPQSESVSISTSPKETTVTETKSEIKPTTNDLSSPTSKDEGEPLLPIPPGAKPPTKSLISAIKDNDELYQKKLFALTDEQRNEFQKQIDDNQSYLNELKVDGKKANEIKKELTAIPNSYLNTIYQVDDDGTEHNMKEYLSNARENNYPFYKMFLANLKVQDMLEFDPKAGKDKIQSFYNDNKLGVLTYTPGQDNFTIVNESEYVKNEYDRLKKIVKANGADATKANEDLNRLNENPKEYFKGNPNALKDIEKIETETPLSQQKVGLYVPATQEQVVGVLQNIDDYTTKATDVVVNSTRNGGTLQTEALTTLGDGASQFVKDYVDPASASQYLIKKIGSRVYKGNVNGTLEYKPGSFIENPNQPDETNNDITNPYQPLIEKKEGNLEQDANLNNYSLESIRQKLDPNSLVDKLAFDIYAHSVGIDDAIMQASANPKYADKIADAAINYAISVDPQLKKQYEALGNQLTEDKVAQLKLEFMNDPYVQSIMADPAQRLRIKEEYKARTGQEVSNDVFNNELLSKGKSDFIKDFKPFAVKDIAVKISNERQRRGMGNSVLDIPTQGEIDPLVDDMVAKGQLTPQEAEIYKTDIKQDISAFRSVASASTAIFGGGTIFLKNPIQTNDFFGQAQQGWGQGLISVDKSLLNWASIANSAMSNTPTMIGTDNMLTKEHALAKMMSDGAITKFVPNEATAVWGNMGNTTGFLAFLIAGGSSLKTLGLTEEVAHGLSAASVFYSTNYEKALQQFPGNEMKDMMMRTASTNIHTLVDVFFIKALPKGTATGKMRDVLVDDINVTLQELKSGVITNVEATAKINSRLYTAATNVLGASVKTANVMTGLSATQEAIGSFLGENNQDISDIVNEGVDNYLPTMLSTAVVSTYTGITQKGAKLNGENITDLAKNYDYFSDRLDKMVQKNPASKKEVDDMRNNLDAIRNAYNTVRDESFKDLTPQQKEKYISLSLYENANMNKATSTSDLAASKKFADIANEIRKQKTQILDNKDKAPEHQQYTVTLPANDFDGLGEGKISEQTQSQQGTITETAGTGGNKKREVQVKKTDDTKRVIANIKDLLSAYKNQKAKYEYLKNMTDEERANQLGELNMDMGKYKSMYDANLNEIAEWITPLLNLLGYEVKANTDVTKLLDNIDLNKIASSKTGESQTLTAEGKGGQVLKEEVPYVRDEKGNYYPTKTNLPKGFKITQNYENQEGVGVLYDENGNKIMEGNIDEIEKTINESYPTGTPEIKNGTNLDLYNNINNFTLKQLGEILQNLDQNGDWSTMSKEVDSQESPAKAEKLEKELLAYSRETLKGMVEDMLTGDKADQQIGFDIAKDGLGKTEVPQQKGEGVGEVKPQSTTIKAGESATITTSEPTKGQRTDVTWKTGESETLTNETGSGGQEPPKQESTEEGGIFEEERRTIFKHRGLQEVATEFGLEDISPREKKSDLQLFKDAENTIDSWVSDGSYEKNVSKIIDSAENKKPLSDEENVILSQHISNLRADMKGMDINSPEYDIKLNELKRVIKAGKEVRSAQGAALRVPTLSTKAKYDLPVMFADKMADLNLDKLTPAQKEGVKKQYEDIQAKLAAAEEKNRILEEKIAEAKAQEALNNASKNQPRKTNKTPDDFKQERKSLKDRLAEQLGIKKPTTPTDKPSGETPTSMVLKSEEVPGPKLQTTTVSSGGSTTTTTGETTGVSTQKGNETITSTGTPSEGEGTPKTKITPAIAKTIAEIAKSHLEESKTKDLKEVTQNTVDEIKDILPNVTEKDVHDIIAGKYAPKKKTKSQLQSDWKNLKEEASLINELEALMNGDESKLTEKQKIQKNQKIKDLKDKIQSYKEESGIADKERIAKAEETARTNIAKLEEKIDNNDIEFDKVEKPTSEQLEEYRSKQKKLRKQLEDMRKEAKVGKYSDQAKLDAAEKQALQNIKDLEEKIDNNDIDFDKTEKPTSDQLEEYRNKQRKLRKQLDDMRKEAKVGRYSDEAKLSSAEKSAQKNIKDLEDKLESNDIAFDKVDKPTSAQLEEYRNKQRKLRKELEQRRKDAKMGRYSDEEKIKSAEKTALLSIKDLEERIDNNDIEFDNVDKPTSAQLEEYRNKQKELRKELENKRKEAKVGRYSDEAKLSSAEKNAQKNIEDLETKLANNDISFDKVENPTSAQLEEYRNKQKKLRKELEARRKEAKMGRYSDEEKIKSAEKAAKENIEDLETKLANNELEFDNVEKPTSDQLKEYREKQKQLRKELEARRKEAKVGRYSDEARIKKAETDLEQSVKDLEQDIADNKIEVEQAQKVNSPKLEELRQKQKELLKLKEQKRKEQKVGRYSDLAKLKALKEANLRAQQKIEEKTKNGDFEPEQKNQFLDDLNLAKNHPKEYQEAMDAIRAKEEAQYEFERARMADQLSKKPKYIKWIVDPVKMGINTITALKASIDNSFAFVQAGLTILNPANVKSTVKALKEQTLDFFSQARFERELTNLHNNKPLWSLIEKCKLDILDPRDLSESKRDEVFGKRSFLNTPVKIGGKSFVIGKYTTAPFDRLYTSLGNNLRLNLFLERINELQADGKTPETHLKEYQDAARTINEMTGRGKLHKGVAKSTEAISTVVWSPRMLASSLNILGLGDIVNIANKSGEKGYYASLEGSKVNFKDIKGSAADFYKSPKGYALRQSIGGISGALSLMYLWSLNPDKEVDLDPRSVSFGTVYDKKSGNSYSVLGRYTSIIRLVSMFLTGEKRSGNRTTELDESRSYGSKRVEEMYKFSRGKFNPVAGEVADFVMQRTYDGKPYVINGIGERTLVPMSVVEIAKGLEQQGWAGIFKRGFPAFYGIKVTSEADFANPLYSAEEINTTPELSTLIQGEVFIPGLKKIDEIEVDKDKNHPDGRMTEAEYKEYVQFKKDRFKEKSKEILNAKWEGTNVRTEDVIYATAEGLNKVMVTRNGITMPKLQDVINQANKKIDNEFFEKKGIKRPITQEVEWKPTEGDIFTPDQKKQDHFKVYEKKGIKIPTMEVKSEIEIDKNEKHPNKEMTDEEYNTFRQKVAEYYDAELSNILYSVYKSDELDEEGIKLGKDVEMGEDLDKYKIKVGDKETNALQQMVNQKYKLVQNEVLKEMGLKKEKVTKSWETRSKIKYNQ